MIFSLAYFKCESKNLTLILGLLWLTYQDVTFSMILSGVLANMIVNAELGNLFKNKAFTLFVVICYCIYLYSAPLSELSDSFRHILRWIMTFLFGMVLCCRSFSGLISSRLVKFLAHSGRASYSLYLMHGAILFFVLKCIHNANVSKTIYFSLWPILVMPIWISISWMLYLISEKPYAQWKESFIFGKKT